MKNISIVEAAERRCAKEGHIIENQNDELCARCGKQLTDVDPEEGEDE
jgi:hypothetical protein